MGLSHAEKPCKGLQLKGILLIKTFSPKMNSFMLKGTSNIKGLKIELTCI